MSAGAILAFFRNAEAISPAGTPLNKRNNVESVGRDLKKEENSKKAEQTQISQKDAETIEKNLNTWTAELQILLKQRVDAGTYYKKGQAHPTMARQALGRYRTIQEQIAALGNSITDLQSTLETFQAKQLLGRMAIRCEQLVAELQQKIEEVEVQLAKVKARIAS